MEYLLYALANNETESYMEQLIHNTAHMAEIDKAKQWAIGQGFHSFRIARHIHGEMPNFAQSVTV